MPHRSKICQEAHSKKARLIRKQRIAFVQNKLKEVANLHKQLTNEENTEKLQRTVEDLGRENYYLEKKGKVLRGLVRDYQDQSRALEGCILMVFILGQLVVGLYFF